MAMSRKYTAALKLQLVKEFKEENERTGMSKAEFAMNHGIPDSTFNDWVIKFEKEGNSFCNITKEVVILNQDIEDKEDKINKTINAPLAEINDEYIILAYNGATITFHNKFLERILKILKEW